MHVENKNVLLLSMPFAGVNIPSIQLAILEEYLSKRNIDIKTKHLYLKASDFYGNINYNFLIYPPNDSYTSQMFYSKYVFPDHWNKNIDKFENYFNDKILHSKLLPENFSFKKFENSTDNFYKWAIENCEWKK